MISSCSNNLDVRFVTRKVTSNLGLVETIVACMAKLLRVHDEASLVYVVKSVLKQSGRIDKQNVRIDIIDAKTC